MKWYHVCRESDKDLGEKKAEEADGRICCFFRLSPSCLLGQNSNVKLAKLSVQRLEGGTGQKVGTDWSIIGASPPAQLDL